MGSIARTARENFERAGLALSNGIVYTTWTSHGDCPPYTSWVIGYDEHTLAQVRVLALYSVHCVSVGLMMMRKRIMPRAAESASRLDSLVPVPFPVVARSSRSVITVLVLLLEASIASTTVLRAVFEALVSAVPPEGGTEGNDLSTERPYEVIEVDGAPVLVMEYLDGQPLSQVIVRGKQGGFPLAMQLRVLADALPHFEKALARDGRTCRLQRE
jgi:hypothetical protein